MNQQQKIELLQQVEQNCFSSSRFFEDFIADLKLKETIQRGFYLYHQKPYFSIMHQGEQVHFSNPTNVGTRINLILFLSSQHSFSYFAKLSKVLQRHIISFLDEKSISSFRLCNKVAKQLAEDDFLWEMKYNRQFVKAPEPMLIEPPRFDDNPFHFCEKGEIVCDKQESLTKDNWRTKFILERIAKMKSKTFPRQIPMKAVGIAGFGTTKIYYKFEVEPEGNINFGSCSLQ